MEIFVFHRGFRTVSAMEDSGNNGEPNLELSDSWHPVLSENFASFSDDLVALDSFGPDLSLGDGREDTGPERNRGFEEDSVGSPSTLASGAMLGAVMMHFVA